MVKTIVIVLGIALAVWLVIAQPWKMKRYDDTPAGQEAKKIDTHVEDRLGFDDKFEAKRFLGAEPSLKVYYEAMMSGMSHKEATAMIDDLYAKGAKEVSFISIRKSVREGTNPEGMMVALPDDPAKRPAIFTAAGPGFRATNKPIPPDVKQKYLYFGFYGWTPETPDAGFMP